MIKVLFLTAELAPIAKVGGLADVAGALPKALANLKVDIRICLPFYGFIDAKKFKPKKIINTLEVPIGDTIERASVWGLSLTSPSAKIPVYLIKHKYFSYKKIYVGKRIMKIGKYTRGNSDVERFAFFTRASLEASRALDFCPNVIHAQDWHTALAGGYLKTFKTQENKKTKKQIENTADFFKNTKTLYTIHNLANQGITSPKIIKFSKINASLEIVKADARNGDINFMTQGILASDIINTVSERYAKEILLKEQGKGLDNILKKRKKDLYGILNGIDMDFFNPEKDKNIYKQYSFKTIKDKNKNKIFLQKKLGLEIDENIPMVGLVSRLVWQKGIELITKKFAGLDFQFVFLGTGQAKYENHLKALAKKYPNKFSAKIMFDARAAQLIYAASDIFLMPSRFEPCGLGQMIAMRYGAVPVVRETGGLFDTITNYELRITNDKFKQKKPNGFSFKKFDEKELYRALKRALDVYYRQPKIWKKIQKNGMKADFSWNKSAKKYLELYKKLAK